MSSEEQGAELNQKPHRKLKVWQASIALWSRFYREIQHFPAHERFGIAAQLQRAAVSIPSNIAEGAARRNTRELLQFLYIARGSLSELDTQWKISFRLGYLEKTTYDRIVLKLEAMSKMLSGLIPSIAKKDRELLTAHCSHYKEEGGYATP